MTRTRANVASPGQWLCVCTLTLLALAGGVPADDPNDPNSGVDLFGVWISPARFGEVRLMLARDRTWSWRRHGQPETRGLFSINQQGLDLGSRTIVRYQIDLLSDDVVTLTRRSDDARITFYRQDEPVPPSVGADNAAVEPLLDNLITSETGHILYTRYTMTQLPEGRERIPLAGIWIMTGNGQHQAPFIDPDGAWSAGQANWDPNGRAVLFVSDFEAARSALYMDIFRANLESGRTERITGAELPPDPNAGWGAVQIFVRLATGIPPSAFSQVAICHQGGGGTIFRSDPNFDIHWSGSDAQVESMQSVILTRVPAGDIWVRCWLSKHIGDIEIIHVEPNQMNAIEPMQLGEQTQAPQDLWLKEGNFLVSNPSISPDGRYLLCLWQHAYYDPDASRRRQQLFRAQGQGTQDIPWCPSERNQGYDTIGVFRLRDNNPLPAASWNAVAMEALAKDPRFSHDGQWIIFTKGVTPCESIAICSLESFLAGRPQVREIAQGQLAPGQGALGYIQPTFSHDSRQVAFVRIQSDLSGNLIGNLCVADPDGGNLRQITRVGVNQIAVWPSFSPDGRHIAFQLITSRGRSLNITDLLTVNLTSNIWTIGVDGENPRQLTTDDASAEPAWGP